MRSNALYPRNQKRRPSLRLGPIVLLPLTLIAASRVQQYSSGGQRDPFVNPNVFRKPAITQIAPPPPLSQRPPGLAGLLISEVAVVGAAASKKRRLAIIKGQDNFSYLAGKGSQLFDGQLTEITDQDVIFTRRIHDTAGNIKIHKVVKRYHTGY